MSGIYPTTPGFSSLRFSSLTPSLVSWSQSMVRQSRSKGSQRWQIEGEYPPNLTRAEISPLIAFLLKQRGQYETFTLAPPDLWATAQGVATGTPLVHADTAPSGRSIETKGWTPSVTGILLAGDFVKFAGHTKVYMITADANSDVSGYATLAIEPALLSIPADDEAVVISSVPFTVALVSDTFDFGVKGPNTHDLKVQFVEVF